MGCTSSSPPRTVESTHQVPSSLAGTPHPSKGSDKGKSDEQNKVFTFDVPEINIAATIPDDASSTIVPPLKENSVERGSDADDLESTWKETNSAPPSPGRGKSNASDKVLVALEDAEVSVPVSVPAIKMGYILKEGGLVKSWKMRWFVLAAFPNESMVTIAWYNEPTPDKKEPYGRVLTTHTFYTLYIFGSYKLFIIMIIINNNIIIVIIIYYYL